MKTFNQAIELLALRKIITVTQMSEFLNNFNNSFSKNPQSDCVYPHFCFLMIKMHKEEKLLGVFVLRCKLFSSSSKLFYFLFIYWFIYFGVLQIFVFVEASFILFLKYSWFWFLFEEGFVYSSYNIYNKFLVTKLVEMPLNSILFYNYSF